MINVSNYSIDELKKMCGVYKITNIVNGKIYIGSSMNLGRRFNDHKNQLSRKKHSNKYLQNSWNKYGYESFTFEVIEIVNDFEDLLKREQYWIDNLNVIDKKIGYNISPTAGSTYGLKDSEETKRKKSEISRQYFLNLTSEQRKKIGEKISKSKLEKHHKMSDESRMKMSIAKKGKNTGKRPKEVGEKISKSKFGHHYTPLGSKHPKSIYTEEFVIKIKLMLNEGISVNEISNELNIKTSAIYDIKLGRTWSHILPELDLSKNNRSGKLNAKKVREIKILLEQGMTPNEIAIMYGVSPTTIRDIKKGKTWGNVKIKEVVGK